MVLFARAAGSGARHSLVIVDMPFGTYELSDDQAVSAAIRLVKEGGAQAVKLEGGGTTVARAKAITDAGIAVMAHLVPTGPLWVSDRWRWTSSELAQRTLDDAVALERAGCFAVMLECVPEVVAAAITRTLSVPTIGFGSGSDCDGQVLSVHDVLGLDDGELSPYSKRYAELAVDARAACERFAVDVREGTFPRVGQAAPMSDEEQLRFADGLAAAADAAR
jgi:3-methyl-2-oxobutanoate hydroxymethyltransferase